MTYRTRIAAALAIFSMTAPQAMAADLTIQVEGIAAPQGAIMLGLFDEASYKSEGSIRGASLEVVGTAVTVTFEDLAPGEYAVKLYHDVNGDGELNTNAIGIPAEPYAFSNNARGRFGPAKWSAARFVVEGDTATHTITLN